MTSQTTRLARFTRAAAPRIAVAVGIALALAVAVLGLAPSEARAFKYGSRFSDDPVTPVDTAGDGSVLESGGGGGRHFTGSRTDGYTCAVCHTGGEPPDVDLQILEFDADPRELRDTGYVPGMTYEITVTMPRTAESAMTAEFVDDDDGRGVGALLALGAGDLQPTETCTRPGDPRNPDIGMRTASQPNDRNVFIMDSCGIVSARFTWTAPPMPVGPIWFNAAVVGADGNGAPTGDGVRVYSQVIPLAGESAEATRTATSCSAAPGANPDPSALAYTLAPLALALALSRRRRRSLR